MSSTTADVPDDRASVATCASGLAFSVGIRQQANFESLHQTREP